MALFGLIGSDKQLAAQYADRESASARAARRQEERDARKAAKRRADHHRNATKVDRAGWAWVDGERRRLGA